MGKCHYYRYTRIYLFSASASREFTLLKVPGFRWDFTPISAIRDFREFTHRYTRDLGNPLTASSKFTLFLRYAVTALPLYAEFKIFYYSCYLGK